MGELNIPGLGVVEIEGDTPNEAEVEAIVRAILERSGPDDEPEEIADAIRLGRGGA